jgi:hypothetical protein
MICPVGAEFVSYVMSIFEKSLFLELFSYEKAGKLIIDSDSFSLVLVIAISFLRP